MCASASRAPRVLASKRVASKRMQSAMNTGAGPGGRPRRRGGRIILSVCAFGNSRVRASGPRKRQHSDPAPRSATASSRCPPNVHQHRGTGQHRLGRTPDEAKRTVERFRPGQYQAPHAARPETDSPRPFQKLQRRSTRPVAGLLGRDRRAQRHAEAERGSTAKVGSHAERAAEGREDRHVGMEVV